jgi:tRNA/rRNA methyltransferase
MARFILINTSHAGNVGAAARALKVMGFSEMVLVAPRWANVLRREETIQRASGANDVLASTRIVDTLDEALDGIDHLCATAMTPRDFGPPTYAPRQYFDLLLNQKLLAQYKRGLEADLIEKLMQNAHPASPTDSAFSAHFVSSAHSAHSAHSASPAPAPLAPLAPQATQVTRVLTPKDDTSPAAATSPNAATLPRMGFLFGSERFGMKNEDVYRCHAALSIPTNPQFGSLNLASAVQLVAYEWRQALGGYAVQAAAAASTLADARAVSGLLTHLEQALVHIGYLDPAAPKKLMPRLNALLNRAELREEEIHILRGVAKAMLHTTPPVR